MFPDLPLYGYVSSLSLAIRSGSWKTIVHQVQTVRKDVTSHLTCLVHSVRALFRLKDSISLVRMAALQSRNLALWLYPHKHKR